MGQIPNNYNQQNEDLAKCNEPHPVNQQIKYEDKDKMELNDACCQVFDSMVTRDFLHSLYGCKVIPLSKKD